MSARKTAPPKLRRDATIIALNRLYARQCRERGVPCVDPDGKAVWRCPECGERYYSKAPQVCHCGEERKR